MFDLDTKEYFVSWDVVFVETEYPFKKLEDGVLDKNTSCSHQGKHNVLNYVEEDERLNACNNQGLSSTPARGTKECNHHEPIGASDKGI